MVSHLHRLRFMEKMHWTHTRWENLWLFPKLKNKLTASMHDPSWDQGWARRGKMSCYHVSKPECPSLSLACDVYFGLNGWNWGVVCGKIKSLPPPANTISLKHDCVRLQSNFKKCCSIWTQEFSKCYLVQALVNNTLTVQSKVHFPVGLQ